MGDSLEDYANSPVPFDKTVGGIRIGMINGVLAFAVPGLVAGAAIGGSIGLERAVLAFFVGGALLTVIGTLVGVIGVRHRVSSYLLTQFVFGRRGASVLNLAIAIGLLGWYGVNMDLMSASLQHVLTGLTDIRLPAWSIELAGGVMMIATAIYGFKLIEKLSSLFVPLLFVLTVYLGVRGFSLWEGNLGQTVAGSMPMSNGEAVTAVAGGFIVSAVLMSDFTRFARRDTDAAIASLLPFLILTSVAYFAAAIAAVSLQQSDILTIMLTLKLGIGAFLLVCLSSWITNVINLYSCSLSLASVFRPVKEWHVTVVAGCLASAAALMNVLDNFTSFLFGLSVIFAPIGGVFIVDFFIVRRCKPYAIENLPDVDKVRPRAMLAWLFGTIIGIQVNQSGLTLTGFEVVDALLSAALLYAMLELWSHIHTRRES